MDAVDTALVDFSAGSPSLISTASIAWPPALRDRLRAVAAGVPINANELALLDTEVGACLADAAISMLSQSGVSANRIEAIGCHGQTVAHSPDTGIRSTLQLGDANVIAERTGITTVNDFRRRDMAAGGQGAPLAPAFHAAFLRDEREDRVVLNLGGIANITVLPASVRETAFGFDTGPANCLMDAWIQQQLGRAYDEAGDWAASAEAVPALLEHLMDEPYFERQPPKTTGTQYFSRNWLAQKLAPFEGVQPARVQATLLQLTARTVADAVHQHAPQAKRVLTCGGGARNPALTQRLAAGLGLPVESTGAFGIDADWMEAMAFAWLAQRTLAGEPGNLPAVTGASGPRVLGAIHPA